jgi:dipeptidyl aminopeptidase/acylaminoacyl peptidase
MYDYLARRHLVLGRFAFKNPKIFILVAVSLAAIGNSVEAKDLHPFTVQDSIELSSFANPVLWTVNQDPPTEPMVSPDGRRFLLTTQRGILATNKTESSIWVLERKAVEDLVTKKPLHQPQPRRIATWQATSNTPVISDVHWLQDSRRVAFLAKKDTGPTQLYSVDLVTKAVTRLTHTAESVSAYDISGETIAYTTFDEITGAHENDDALLDVTGKSIWALLWRNRSINEREEARLLPLPNTLHLLKNGREIHLPFRFENRSLKLFFPVLSLSPNGKSLITVAQVANIPPEWRTYQPRFGYEDLVLVPGSKSSSEPENAWKASQFVNVNLETGVAEAVVDAPAGRSVFQIFAPTKAIWSSDSETVLLSNTFLPLTEADATVNAARSASPAAVTVNLRHHTLDTIAYFPQPARGSSPSQHVADVLWNLKTSIVSLLYASSPDNVLMRFHDTYRWIDSRWKRAEGTDDIGKSIRLSVYQDLNHAPVLVGSIDGGEHGATIWDPNPQLTSIALGKASPYEWPDVNGATRRGILVLPSDYVPGRRYPLVIQTHGFEPKKFFTDGIYTTGSGGRALCSRGIIVLQTEQYSKTGDYRGDAEIEVEAFRSAIQKLSEDGLIDPKRVGVIGFSFTVYHALYVITHYPDLLAAASITAGNDLSYWLYLLWTDIPFAQEMAETANGGVKPFGKEGLSKWQDSAPGFNLDRVRAPLLISCLEKGTLVATWDIYGGLRTLKKPVDLVWLKSEDAPHVLVQPRHRFLSQELAVDWFDFWLNGHEDPNPGKAGQYAKWRELRELKDTHGAPIKAH